jgi:basic membrane protein A and related proteins
MSKKIYSFFALLLVTVMILSACAPAAQPTEEAEPVATEEPAEVEEPVEPEEPADEGFKACQVTDTGGIDDQSFNATAWKGIEDAMTELDVEGKYLESQQQTDYEKNINAFIEDGCDIIVTVGFLLGDATAAMAEANPDQKFSIVDFAYDPGYDNVLGQVFNTQEAAFLAGYVAAAVSKTGKVGTFGGIQIPPVTVFMDGYALGVEYYNKEKGANVEVLGWDPYTATGLFTGNFESTDDGRTMGESLMDEGADVIMPVAGPVGFGTAAAAQERGNVYIIGVDSDWYLTAPDYKDIVLTSVLKKMDVTTLDAIKTAMDGTFAGGVTVGTLENGGVGLAPFHDLESLVPTDVTAELETIKAGIIDGSLSAVPGEAPEAEPAAVTDIGTPDHPIKVLFVPSTDIDFMIESGDIIENALNSATGLTYEVSVPTSYATTIEEMCASPEDTIGFIPAMGYALANQLCGVQPGLASERYGRNVYWAQFIVQRDSEYQSLEDLEGASWGYGEVTSTSGYLYPKALLSDLGVTVGEEVETGGHPETVKAVYNGEVDFGTTFFSPPNPPEGRWEMGDPPDVPDDVVTECGLDEDGKFACGGYVVLDARQTISEEAPDVIEKVRILDLTKEIPNDTMSFSPDFPEDLKQMIIDALIAFLQTEECQESLCNTQFYSWTAASPIYDENFDGIRILMEAQGISLENIGQ